MGRPFLRRLGRLLLRPNRDLWALLLLGAVQWLPVFVFAERQLRLLSSQIHSRQLR